MYAFMFFIFVCVYCTYLYSYYFYNVTYDMFECMVRDGGVILMYIITLALDSVHIYVSALLMLIEINIYTFACVRACVNNMFACVIYMHI